MPVTEKKKKTIDSDNEYTTVSIEKTLKQELDSLVITMYGVRLRTTSDKIRFLLHLFHTRDGQ